MLDLRYLVNAVASSIGPIADGPPGEGQRIWQEARNFAVRILGAATERWIPFYARREPCHVMPLRAGVPFACPSHAILICDACGHPACMNHVQVDQSGQGTCFTCIGRLINQTRAAAPPPHAHGAARDHGASTSREDPEAAWLREALKELGLKEGAQWAAVQAAHRKLAAKYHPDRARTPAARKRAAEKSVRVNSTFAMLKQYYERKAVA